MTAKEHLRRRRLLRAARRELRRLIKAHPILKGTKIKIGNAYGHQAVCFYRSKLIVLDPHPKADIKRIVRHECGHIFDYQVDGKIDFGEKVPQL